MKPFIKMKKIKTTITLTLLLFAASFYSFTPLNDAPEKAPIEMPDGCHYGQCQAIAKSTGVQCKHCVSERGDLYCWQHK